MPRPSEPTLMISERQVSPNTTWSSTLDLGILEVSGTCAQVPTVLESPA